MFQSRRECSPDETGSRVAGLREIPVEMLIMGSCMKASRLDLLQVGRNHQSRKNSV